MYYDNIMKFKNASHQTITWFQTVVSSIVTSTDSPSHFKKAPRPTSSDSFSAEKGALGPKGNKRHLEVVTLEPLDLKRRSYSGVGGLFPNNQPTEPTTEFSGTSMTEDFPGLQPHSWCCCRPLRGFLLHGLRLRQADGMSGA